MTVARHILQKDVRRHAAWLVAWAVTCAVVLMRDDIAEMLMPSPEWPMWLRIAAMTGVGLARSSPVVRVGLFLLLIPMVVHEDPIVDSRAFWLTRPIGGRTLLAAKLLFVGMLLVLPTVVVDLVQLARDGARPWQLALAVPEIVLDWSVPATVVVLLSSLTTTTRGVLAAAVKSGLFTNAVFVVLVLLAVLAKRFSFDTRIITSVFVHDFTQSLFAASRAVAMVLAVALTIAATVMHYATRRTRLTWAAIPTIVVCIVGTSFAWRWDFIGMAQPAIAALNVSGLTVDVDGISVTPDAADPPSSTRPVHGSVHLVVGGIPAAIAADPYVVHGTLAIPGRTPIGIGGLRGRVWNATAVESLLEGARIVNGTAPQVDQVAVLLWSLGELATPVPPARLTMRVEVPLRAYRLAGVLPLEPGARQSTGGTETTIRSVACSERHCSVEIEDAYVPLLLRPDPVMQDFGFARERPILYVLRNRERGEVLWPIVSNDPPVPWSMKWMRRLTSRLRYESTDGGPRLDPRWLAGAEIVRVTAEVVQTVTRDVDENAVTLTTAERS